MRHRSRAEAPVRTAEAPVRRTEPTEPTARTAEPTARTAEPTARAAETPIASARNALSGLSDRNARAPRRADCFPLSSDLRSSVRYLLLEEGLSSGLVSVREVQKEGSVPNLAVENRSDSDVLIVDGEELVGAKQNRIANLTLLVPAQRTTTIPVSCVEAGRWSYSRPDFAVTERVQYSRGRAARLRGVQASMRTTGTRVSDQGAVWDDLDETAARMEAHSPTGAMRRDLRAPRSHAGRLRREAVRGVRSGRGHLRHRSAPVRHGSLRQARDVCGFLPQARAQLRDRCDGAAAGF